MDIASLEPTLSSKIELLPNSCWLWSGARRGIYGVVRIGRTVEQVHRLLFERLNGKPIGKHKPLFRACETVGCVNPYHHTSLTPRTPTDDRDTFMCRRCNLLKSKYDFKIKSDGKVSSYCIACSLVYTPSVVGQCPHRRVLIEEIAKTTVRHVWAGNEVEPGPTSDPDYTGECVATCLDCREKKKFHETRGAIPRWAVAAFRAVRIYQDDQLSVWSRHPEPQKNPPENP